MTSLSVDDRLAAAGIPGTNGATPDDPADLPDTTGESWLEVDLDEVMATVDAGPELMSRDDGQCLLYRGRTHWFSGEPETGKSWLLIAAAAQALAADERVLYIDFEDDAAGFVARLDALGIDARAMRRTGLLRYLRPLEPLTSSSGKTTRAELNLGELCDWAPALAVIDGCTEAMTLEGLDLERNRDVATWLVVLPRRLARAGAAVAVIDHVTKSKENRGRYAIGGQHKLAALDGAAFSCEVVRPFGRAIVKPIEGLLRVRIGKDRRGHLRGAAINDVITEARITSYPDGGITVHLDPPGTSGQADDHQAKVVEHLAIYDGASKSDLRTLGNSDALDTAIKALIALGHVTVEKAGRAHLHHLTDPGRTAWADTLDNDEAA